MSAPTVEGALTAPNAVAFARRDAITPIEHGRWLADHIPGARLRELPGADHLWWLPEPSAIADLITDFTEEHSR